VDAAVAAPVPLQLPLSHVPPGQLNISCVSRRAWRRSTLPNVPLSITILRLPLPIFFAGRSS
jgi:hypothetical protein